MRAPRRLRSERRRPRRGGRGRRTIPGTESCRPACRSRCAGDRPLPGGSLPRPREPARGAIVTAESGSPARRAWLRTRWSPRSRSPSRNQSSPPSAETVPSASHVSPARPQPRSSSCRPGKRVEDAVEVGRDGETEDVQVVADVADHGHVARIDRADEAAREARPADAAGEERDLHGSTSWPSAACVRGPARRPIRCRSSIVSTSSRRFGITAATAITPCASKCFRKRLALPSP